MEFKTRAQQSCYEKVSRWLKEMFGEMAMASPESRSFMVPLGTSAAFVIVFDWGDDDAVVCVRATVVRKVEITPELMSFLLHENNNMRFGAFGLDSDNDIFFEHSIVGSTCDKEELRASVLAVASTADKYDDKIVSRWGGLRMADGR